LENFENLENLAREKKKSSENLSYISRILGIFFPQIFNITKLGRRKKKEKKSLSRHMIAKELAIV
jgi:hypothetical protein